VQPQNSPIPNFESGPNNLLPVIAQDASNQRVLMMAWMNAEAWEETLRSGHVVYFSRSRNQLWRKGETSGHRQRVVEIRVDCDADTILIMVEQTGAACHEGYESCFFRKVDADNRVTIAEKRLVNPEDVYGSTK